MSAYLVDDEHIHVMLWAAERYSGYGPLRWYYGNPEDMGTLEDRNTVGQMLIDANLRSVNHRYNETTPATTYRYQQPRHIGWSVGELLNAIDGYEYQASCDALDWRDGAARAFCQALKARLIQHVPGYEEGPWTITTEDRPLAVTKVRSA